MRRSGNCWAAWFATKLKPTVGSAVMYRAGFYRGGPILMSAIAGIDQALWDIKGKVLNAPVWQLMGGLVREKIKAYSWVGGDRPADVIDFIVAVQS